MLGLELGHARDTATMVGVGLAHARVTAPCLAKGERMPGIRYHACVRVSPCQGYGVTHTLGFFAKLLNEFVS